MDSAFKKLIYWSGHTHGLLGLAVHQLCIKGFFSFSYQERLSNLKIYSLQRRRERYIIIYVWKILENFVPNLVKPLQFYVSDRRGRLCSVSHGRLGHWLNLALGGKVLECLIHCQCTSETLLHAPLQFSSNS